MAEVCSMLSQIDVPCASPSEIPQIDGSNSTSNAEERIFNKIMESSLEKLEKRLPPLYRPSNDASGIFSATAIHTQQQKAWSNDVQQFKMNTKEGSMFGFKSKAITEGMAAPSGVQPQDGNAGLEGSVGQQHDNRNAGFSALTGSQLQKIQMMAIWAAASKVYNLKI